jgi:hypothetical protein
MADMNVGELSIALKLDDKQYNRGMKSAVRSGNSNRQLLEKPIYMKVDLASNAAIRKEVDRLGQGADMLRRKLANLYPKRGEGREVARQLREIEQRMRTLNQVAGENKAGGMLGKLSGALGGAAKFAGPLGLALGAAGIVTGVAAFGKSMIDMAKAAVESENLFEVSMGGMAASARQWSNETSKALGLNSFETRKMLGTFNVMLSSMGMFPEDAFKMSTGLTKLAHDMASFYNLDPGEAFEKLQSGLTGEIEPLKRLGIVISDATVKNYAMQAGISAAGRDMNEQQKILSRYNLIMQATSKAQGDLARTASSPANMDRRLAANKDERMTKVGMKMLPVYKALQMFLMKILEAIDKLQVAMENVFAVLKGIWSFFTKKDPNTLLSSLLGMADTAARAAKIRADSMALMSRTASEGAINASRYAKSSADEEIEKIMDVMQKRREEAAERRKQFQESLGWASAGTSIWERGMAASMKRAAGSKTEARLTAANMPQPKEIVNMSKDIAKMQTDTEQIKDNIKAALSYA